MAINNVTNPAAAASAYANIAKTAQSPGIEAGSGPSFDDYIKQAAVESVETLKGGETASANPIMGKANLTDVVDAITSAELTLQTVVAVRDKMVQAYQDIMRMPI